MKAVQSGHRNDDVTQGMARLSGGTFRMGSDHFYAEEAPVHSVAVDAFWIDRTPVTNRQFRDFVNTTGYVTLAEKAPDPQLYPGALPEMLHPASLLFTPPAFPVGTDDWNLWWSFVPGACWKQPAGPGSSLRGLFDHPVVHVAFEDALAYARWAGKDLPTEAEWEYAARGGLDGAEYAWGDAFMPGGKPMANTWQGMFPHQNLLEDGYAGTSPVNAFPPNGYGVFDMIGNVWEWTIDFYAPQHDADAAKPCCIPQNPCRTDAAASIDPCDADMGIPRRVMKGGSHLCAPNYCMRYRPAARHAQAIDTSTSHLGFRCVVRDAGAGG